MKPHVRERRPDVWQILFDAGPDPLTGKRRQRSRTIHGTHDQAIELADRIAAEIEAGLHVDDASLTVGDLIDTFLAAKATQVAPSTLTTYRHWLAHLEPISRRKVSAISGGTLTLLYARLLETHSPAVVASTHKVARIMFRAAVKWGYMSADPTARAEVPRYRTPQVEAWSADDLNRFLSLTDGHPLHPAFVLLAMTGMRRGEVCGLRWSDVDLSAGTLTVRNTRTTTGGVHEGPPKTASSRRTISLDEWTVEYLRALRASRPTGLISADTFVKHDGRLPKETPVLPGAAASGVAWTHVITTSTGEPYNPTTVTQTFGRLVKRHGLPPLRLHGLRHTWATLALEAGVHVRVVADRLGHATPAITLSIYSHSTPKLDREAAEAVSRLVAKG